MLLAAFGAALSFGLIILPDIRAVSADTPWPTPPPGPRPPVLRIVDDASIKFVEVPAIPGARSWVIPPSTMALPRFPPVPSFPFEASDGVRIIVDAGSTDTTVQLVYKPVPIVDAPPTGRFQEIRQVFDFTTFNHNGDRDTVKLLRPWVLEVPVPALTHPTDDPARFVLGHYIEGEGWETLVTNYLKNRGVLQARVLKMGRFAVLAEPSIIILSGTRPD